jgi:uncharacterized protein (DUF2384 family)
MGSSHHLTESEQLTAELEHPDANSIWARALETFGDEATARHWMNSARDIFGGRSAQQLVDTGEPSEQRRVLTVLIRIDYGVFS